MTEQAKRNPHLVHVIRVGDIAIDIVRGTTQDGHHYLYREDSRAWTTRNRTRENFTQRFYETNEKDHIEAIREASAWIRKHRDAAAPSWKSKPVEVPLKEAA